MGNVATHAVKPAARETKRAAAATRAPTRDTTAALFGQLGNHRSSRASAPAPPVLPAPRAALGNRHAAASLDRSALRRGGNPLPHATRRFFRTTIRA